MYRVFFSSLSAGWRLKSFCAVHSFGLAFRLFGACSLDKLCGRTAERVALRFILFIIIQLTLSCIHNSSVIPHPKRASTISVFFHGKNPATKQDWWGGVNANLWNKYSLLAFGGRRMLLKWWSFDWLASARSWCIWFINWFTLAVMCSSRRGCSPQRWTIHWR